MELIRMALAPVLRDVEATTDVRLAIENGAQSEAQGPWVLVRVPDGSGTGVYLNLGDSESERIRAVAEQVQDIVIEELWARASNWPMCPSHRSAHPMQTMLIDDEAWWGCPADSSSVSRIGALRL